MICIMKKAIFCRGDKQVIWLLIPLRDTAPQSGLSGCTEQQWASPGNLGLHQEGLALYEEALKSYSQAIASYDKFLATREEMLKIYCQTITIFDWGTPQHLRLFICAHQQRLAHGSILQTGLSKHQEGIDIYCRAIEVFSRSLDIAPLRTTIREQLKETLEETG